MPACTKRPYPNPGQAEHVLRLVRRKALPGRKGTDRRLLLLALPGMASDIEEGGDSEASVDEVARRVSDFGARQSFVSGRPIGWDPYPIRPSRPVW